MDRKMELDHLALADREVADGESHIAREEQMVSDLDRGGHDTKLALETLATYRRMQAEHIAHRNSLQNFAGAGRLRADLSTGSLRWQAGDA